MCRRCPRLLRHARYRPAGSSTGTPWAASSPWSTRYATPAIPGRWCSSPHSPGSTWTGSSRSSAEPAATRLPRSSERVYGGDSASVTPEEWAACWRLFGPWVVGEQERARTIVNVELNAPGLELMRGFDVLDQLARIECPTLVCVGELDPITPVGRRPRDRRRPARGDRAARGRRGCGPLHLEGRPGSLLAAGHRFRDDHDGFETTLAAGACQVASRRAPPGDHPHQPLLREGALGARAGGNALPRGAPRPGHPPGRRGRARAAAETRFRCWSTPEGVLGESRGHPAPGSTTRTPPEQRLFPADAGRPCTRSSGSAGASTSELGPKGRRLMYVQMLAQRELMLQLQQPGRAALGGPRDAARLAARRAVRAARARHPPGDRGRGRGGGLARARLRRGAARRRPPAPVRRALRRGRPDLRGAVCGGRRPARVRRPAATARRAAAPHGGRSSSACASIPAGRYALALYDARGG